MRRRARRSGSGRVEISRRRGALPEERQGAGGALGAGQAPHTQRRRARGARRAVPAGARLSVLGRSRAGTPGARQPRALGQRPETPSRVERGGERVAFGGTGKCRAAAGIAGAANRATLEALAMASRSRTYAAPASPVAARRSHCFIKSHSRSPPTRDEVLGQLTSAR